jgi:bifunctional non-homologous end joining protein LigD
LPVGEEDDRPHLVGAEQRGSTYVPSQLIPACMPGIAQIRARNQTGPLAFEHDPEKLQTFRSSSCGRKTAAAENLMAETKLSKYRSKRDFTKTAEPSDETEASPSPRLRFVIQKHAATRLHYDLRLEMGGVFKSWAVTRGPSLDPHDKRLAVETEDHPLAYGDFEGTIPKGQYGGGTVQLWDRGYWSVEGRKTPEKALESGDLKFTLEGKRLHGSWVLVRMKSDRDGGKRTNWLLIKHRDAAAREGDGEAILKEDRSVASGRSMAEIAKGKGKGPKPFMLAGDGAEGADRASGSGIRMDWSCRSTA